MNTPRSFEDCQALWKTRKRKLANNTYLENDGYMNEEKYWIRLHKTCIVQFFKDGSIVLNSGGYQTVTTKERMNAALPQGCRIYSEKGVWIISGGPKDADKPSEYAYRDGMRIRPDGSIEGAGPSPDASRKLRARAKRFAHLYMEAFEACKVPAPGPGDCWYCGMMDTNGKTMGEGDSSHILEHMKERYFVPSMLVNAIKRFPVSECAMNYRATRWADNATDKDREPNTWNKIGREQCEKSLRRYLYSQLGLPT